MNTGYVYKIYDNTNNNVYYGSTKERLSKRIAGHRRSYKQYLNGEKNFITSFKILENGDYHISLVEQVNFNDKYELHARERHYIENNECINKNIPNRTQKEYIQVNKEQIKERKKQYMQVNKEQNKEKHKQYYEANKEHILEQRKGYIKKYYQINKDKIREQNKKWKEANKEKRKEYLKQYYEANKKNK